ncbi:MAG: ATP phosphoribosyltransferase (EC [uncultured Campylobacterales bacterium]|uniref:ATP phosphoribosyltransferase n=1 Tax=uncultured Campylobacterales bacterium TaxID=352960 RepID=A0A6S6SCD6_9BACT|nr:MAG: ATP phosphoribosyltransferase (EC [uncultured Campylobacterales bacterium]
MLKIALPKGRIAKETLDIFESIFNQKFNFEDRKLILRVDDFEFLLVRNQDVPTYVYNGAADLGVVGLDVLEEKQFDIMHLLDLGIGKCRICIGIPNDSTLNLNSPEITIATKLENIAKKYFASHAISAKIIKLNGSIELAPLIGLSDAIVDIVETGTTMKQNGLKVDREIMTSTAHLIANQNSFIQKRKEILNLSEKIKEKINK